MNKLKSIPQACGKENQPSEMKKYGCTLSIAFILPGKTIAIPGPKIPFLFGNKGDIFW
jgi:hypothetical protein